ncbi:MAG: hypothetical protein KBT31_04960 [Firmicutes bacterium]|nr:hypothetical protein [Candidatus Colimorpha enterica]
MKSIGMKIASLVLAVLTVIAVSSCAKTPRAGEDTTGPTVTTAGVSDVTTADETTAEETTEPEKDYTELINYALSLLNDDSELNMPTEYMSKYLGNYKLSDIEWSGYAEEPFKSIENVGGVAKVVRSDGEGGTFCTYTFSSGDYQYTVYGDKSGYALISKDPISPYYSASIFYDLGMPLDMVFGNGDDEEEPMEDITPDQLTVLDENTVGIGEGYLEMFADRLSKTFTEQFGGSVSDKRATGFVSTLDKDRGLNITVSFRHTLLGDCTVSSYQKDFDALSTVIQYSTSSNGIPVKIRITNEFSDIKKQGDGYFADTLTSITETSYAVDGSDVVDTQQYTLRITDDGFTYRSDVSENVTTNGQSTNQSVSTLIKIENMTVFTLQNYEGVVPTSKMKAQIKLGEFKSDCPSAKTLLKAIGEKG